MWSSNGSLSPKAMKRAHCSTMLPQSIKLATLTGPRPMQAAHALSVLRCMYLNNIAEIVGA